MLIAILITDTFIIGLENLLLDRNSLINFFEINLLLKSYSININ